jgi:hypothetical protein
MTCLSYTSHLLIVSSTVLVVLRVARSRASPLTVLLRLVRWRASRTGNPWCILLCFLPSNFAGHFFRPHVSMRYRHPVFLRVLTRPRQHRSSIFVLPRRRQNILWLESMAEFCYASVKSFLTCSLGIVLTRTRGTADRTLASHIVYQGSRIAQPDIVPAVLLDLHLHLFHVLSKSS